MIDPIIVEDNMPGTDRLLNVELLTFQPNSLQFALFFLFESVLKPFLTIGDDEKTQSNVQILFRIVGADFVLSEPLFALNLIFRNFVMKI